MSEHDWRENYDKPIDDNSVDFLRDDTRHRLGKCIEKAELPQMHDIRESRLVALVDALRKRATTAEKENERLTQVKAAAAQTLKLIDSLVGFSMGELHPNDLATPELRAALKEDAERRVGCDDCGAPYGEDGWCDVVIPNETWNSLGAGLLCFRCMTKRLVARGLADVPVLVASGPYRDANEEWRLIGIDHGQRLAQEDLFSLRATVAGLEKERDEARDWVRRMHCETQVLTCAFCGEAFPPNTPSSGSAGLTAHISLCAKHPMRTTEARIVALEHGLRPFADSVRLGLGYATVGDFRRAAVLLAPAASVPKAEERDDFPPKCENCPTRGDAVRFWNVADVHLCDDCAVALGYKAAGILVRDFMTPSHDASSCGGAGECGHCAAADAHAEDEEMAAGWEQAQRDVAPIIAEERKGEILTSEDLDFRMGTPAPASKSAAICGTCGPYREWFARVGQPRLDAARQAGQAEIMLDEFLDGAPRPLPELPCPACGAKCGGA
jgi:hypothetical protein